MGRIRIEPKPKHCKVCQGPVDQPKVGRTREHCSAACRQRAYERRKGQSKRASKQAEREQQRIEALPIWERNMDRAQRQPLITLADGAKVFRCMACGKIYMAEREQRKKYKDCCSNACYLRLRRYETEFYDALEVLSQQNSKASWPIKRRDNEGKHSPLCAHCGLPYEPNFGKPGRPKKYCSPKCCKAAYEQRWKSSHNSRARVHRFRNCAECGEKFDRTDAQGRRLKRFCSRACMRRQRDRRRWLRERGETIPAGMRTRPVTGGRRRKLMKNFRLLENGWKRVGEHGEFVIYVGDEKHRVGKDGAAKGRLEEG